MDSFVASADQVAAISAVIAKPRFVNCEMLSVTVGTDPAWLQHVIPAPLVADGDSVRIMIGRWQSNCVEDFSGAGIYVPARLGDVHGEYILAMYMDTDAAIIYGREVFGEPKKQASVQLRRANGVASGWVERRGERIIHLEAELVEDTGPLEATGVNFNIKATPSSDGNGLEHDAVITIADFDVRLSATMAGPGGIALKGNGHDPLDTIPITDIRGAVWQEGDLLATSHSAATIPSADFLPYYFARIDDYSLLDSETRALTHQSR
ncbi:MAG: acetoacetate decarboxylase family protein [Candidatus Nanopelagicales bacterium]